MQNHAKSITVIDKSYRHCSTFATRAKTLIKQRDTSFFDNAEKRCKVPDKTYGNEAFPTPKIGKGIQNNEKVLGFSL